MAAMATKVGFAYPIAPTQTELFRRFQLFFASQPQARETETETEKYLRWDPVNETFYDIRNEEYLKANPYLKNK